MSVCGVGVEQEAANNYVFYVRTDATACTGIFNKHFDNFFCIFLTNTVASIGASNIFLFTDHIMILF